jgi:hypothetical protein
MSHYQLTEDQEFAIYETRNALSGITQIVDSIGPGRTLNIKPEEISALLSLLSARLPQSSDMLFVSEITSHPQH